MNIEQILQQLEDPIAIRELVHQYAYCADTLMRKDKWLFLLKTPFHCFHG